MSQLFWCLTRLLLGFQKWKQYVFDHETEVLVLELINLQKCNARNDIESISKLKC